jgi:dTDP-4-dehydrorhamnose 3,5-epimerase
MTATVVEASAMPGLVVRELTVHGDGRGCFVESFRQEWFPGRPNMVQGNRSDSAEGVLRGLHFHHHQSDYWYVPRGQVLVALVDLRTGSPTEDSVATFTIGDGHPLGVYIPPGVAHGYYSLTDCTMTYMVDRYYDPQDERGVAWDDPWLGIAWPSNTPTLSGRDQHNPCVADLDPSQRLPFQS